jgi:hypothetical protein
MSSENQMITDLKGNDFIEEDVDRERDVNKDETVKRILEEVIEDTINLIQEKAHRNEVIKQIKQEAIEEILKRIQEEADRRSIKLFEDRIKFTEDLMRKKEIYDFKGKTNIWEKNWNRLGILQYFIINYPKHDGYLYEIFNKVPYQFTYGDFKILKQNFPKLISENEWNDFKKEISQKDKCKKHLLLRKTNRNCKKNFDDKYVNDPEIYIQKKSEDFIHSVTPASEYFNKDFSDENNLYFHQIPQSRIFQKVYTGGEQKVKRSKNQKIRRSKIRRSKK